MDNFHHDLSDIFNQLGLPSDKAAIERFIEEHRPLASATALPEASFWTPSQREFLSQELMADADWAESIDQLNSRLR